MEAQYHMCKNSIQVLFNTHELIDKGAPILMSKYIRYWEERILEVENQIYFFIYFVSKYIHKLNYCLYLHYFY